MIVEIEKVDNYSIGIINWDLEFYMSILPQFTLVVYSSLSFNDKLLEYIIIWKKTNWRCEGKTTSVSHRLKILKVLSMIF